MYNKQRQGGGPYDRKNTYNQGGYNNRNYYGEHNNYNYKHQNDEYDDE